MTHSIAEKFEQMGARADVMMLQAGSWMRSTNRRGFPRRGHFVRPLDIDLRRDGHGAFFFIRYRSDVRLDVCDVRPHDRHLLLQARSDRPWSWGSDEAARFLCGHDERSWFVAAIPESERVADVQQAKDALKPQAVWDAIKQHDVPMHERDRRVTDAFIRQGEWFFLPRPEMEVNERDVLRREPIQRGAGRAHICQFLYREGGEEVYVSARYPFGLSAGEYHKLDRREKQQQRWTTMQRDAHVFVRGAIQHPDHETVFLWCWHEVVPNRETEAKAMEHVVFLD
jgi:hypothetical protein